MSGRIYTCDTCGRTEVGVRQNGDCGMTQPDDIKCTGKFGPPSMTQEEVENWIMLKGQSDERWFEIRVLDEKVNEDPVMRALLEALSDMIHKGVMGMPFMESQNQRKSGLEIVGKGDPPR